MNRGGDICREFSDKESVKMVKKRKKTLILDEQTIFMGEKSI